MAPQDARESPSGPSMLRQLISRFLGDISGEVLRSTAKAAAVAGVFSVGTAYYLSTRIEGERRALDQLAANAQNQRVAGRPGVDMSTTGSILRSPQTLRIDPCGEPIIKR
jgi:hypothetical protein